MDAQLLAAWGPILEGLVADEAILDQVLAENEWFAPSLVQHAVACMRPWWDVAELQKLRACYPVVHSPKRIGLILAGNLPLVGLHDVLMVLLSGHHAIVKPSHKDRVLLRALIAQSPEALRARVTFVESLAPGDIDFLLATGSNATARQLAEAFEEVPKFMRQNRFSVAVLLGNENQQQLAGLAKDILTYHGMGCRSVSSVLVPPNYDLMSLVRALEAFEATQFAPIWRDVLRYERAVEVVLDRQEPACEAIVLQYSTNLKPPKIGILNVVTYETDVDRDALLEAAQAELQCIVDDGHIAFGHAQMPALEDFADSVDTLAILTNC